MFFFCILCVGIITTENAAVDLIKERKHFDMLKGVEGFDVAQLKKTDTVEKLVLPKDEGLRIWAFVCVCV